MVPGAGPEVGEGGVYVGFGRPVAELEGGAGRPVAEPEVDAGRPVVEPEGDAGRHGLS